MRRTIFDIEVSPTKSMVGFLDIETNEIKQFQYDETEQIQKYIKQRMLIGYNNISYDNVILTAMLKGKSAKEIYKISVDLIEHDGKHWDYGTVLIDSYIDLIEVVAGSASLKLYGSRLNTKKLQDLPYNPHEKHNKKMWKEVCKYNKNDLRLTKELYEFLQPQLELREKIGNQYKINVMSRSDAQIAEDIFEKELNINKKKIKVARPNYVYWTKPEWISFKSKDITNLVNDLKNTPIEINKKNGQPITPDILNKQRIVINKGVYTVGIGGLHSNEKSVAYVGELGNVDVASYYPSIIINSRLYPPHLGEEWLELYTKIRNERIVAKKNGDKVKSDVFKIILNGSYGKLGSYYSFLYAPELLINVTLTGQYALLMLIEWIEDAGIQVISSNTDGIEVLYKSSKDKSIVKKLVSKWEEMTGYEMEYGFYKALYSRDVNSYIAIYDDHVKSKGFYGEPKIDKNIEYPIVTEAIRKFLFNETPMELTIKQCKDPAQFCVARTVTGGALWSPETYPDTEEYTQYIYDMEHNNKKKNKALEKRNENYQKEFVLLNANKWYLGKVVRYYYSTNGNKMYYKTSGNTVPKSEGCKPMMKLSKKIPKDMDYNKYINLAYTHLEECGYIK